MRRSADGVTWTFIAVYSVELELFLRRDSSIENVDYFFVLPVVLGPM